MDASTGREVLPKNVKPLHYDVTLEPNFEKFTLDVKEDSTSISLNTLELDIHSTKISSGGSDIAVAPQLAYNEDSQTTTISFERKLPAGTKAVLTQTFTGYLNDKLAGFYRSSYKDKDGSTKWLASTQFEATDARRAFPCFDEPALKAEFTVTLIADKHLVCLSNMDVASEKEINSSITGGMRKAVRFNRSPLMSTYLVAFIVGELNYVETKEFRIPIRVYATPDKDIEHGKFSLDLAAKTLAFYEKEFAAPFPLPKMDMAAIPDFSAGAMENWGLVTYRVVDLLFDEKTSGAGTKQRIAEVVQHELAHQWFGNLVTMDFWEGLWLNEGFATWMSWYSCNKFYPEWKVWEGFVTDNLQGALSLDSLRSSHPIEVPVKRADEISQIFDAISYSKGSCVIVMLSKYLGEETFMEGIRLYIKKHAYGNTRTEDLWAALAEASGKPVEKVMAIWTKNVGYPVVTVTENPDNKSIHVKQNRFLRTSDVKSEEDETLFPVFLGLRTKSGINEGLTLSVREQDYHLPDGTSFYKLNTDHTSTYRTSYTPSHLKKLGEAAASGLLSTSDRAGMVADAGALASSGYQSTSGLLSLLKSFSAETEFIVWEELLTRISAIRSAWLFEPQSIQDALKTFHLSLVSTKAHEKGWTFSPSDGQIETQFKALLFGSAGLAGDEKIISAALDLFAKFASGDRGAINPNIRASVYAIALRLSPTQQDKEKAYDTLLNEYHTAPTADERNTALRALSRVGSNAALTKHTIELPLSDDVKAQDVYLPIAGLRTDKEGVEALWEWMTTGWEKLNVKLPPGLGGLSNVISICVGGFTSEEQRDVVKKWFEGRSTKGFDRALEQSLDAVQAKANWLKRDGGDVEGWLVENGYLSKSGEKL
ncbi:uncharacterized protein KY384_009161 [Bacidia gigantensis]|uniref:uncharacterized protein n=1 Tax=Bacidia gigantensis TaxID=2732470 RepID=UPI001D0598FF|nr:uncharacterized protein KY384_009161 [Bacidia gigantensis]KAG8525517.1 hypothetical protein KY384_009161 [Bacidia gigantensis]